MTSTRLQYIPEIDGLRALAILGVLFFHLHLPLSSLGWAGVELFFVLSGFLITRILLNSRDRPRYFRTFYLRRAFRIFPIYYLVVILYALAGGLHGVLPYYLTYTQTITQLRTGFTDAPWLGHTWTLAIEEQFYMLWPMVVLFSRGRKQVFVLLGMVGGGLLVRYLLQGGSPFLVDGWLGVQVDTFGMGAVLAYATHSQPRHLVQRWSSVACGVGLAILLVLIALVGLHPFWTPVTWTQTAYGPWLITILALVSVGLTGMAATGHPYVKYLSLAPLVALGRISYGVYLYHPFVFRFVNRVFDHFARFPLRGVLWLIACLVCTVAVAQVSWWLIEGPCLRLKERLSERTARRVRTLEKEPVAS